MRGFPIILGLLLALGGGALAGAQYAPVDLSMLDSVAGAKEFIASPMALYAGAGAAGFGLLLIVIAIATGGKEEKPGRIAKSALAEADNATRTERAVAPEPASVVAAKPAEPAPELQPYAAAPTPHATPVPAAKPTASGQPPPSSDNDPLSAWRRDPRLLNRKRVSDLVSINDALKAYYAKNGAYPKATGLSGFRERGVAWIPGLSPDFVAALPRDPALSGDAAGPQYVYVSDGTDYKLLAQSVSLLGGTQVEVLGVRIDPTRHPTAENASFGFWSPGFASA